MLIAYSLSVLVVIQLVHFLNRPSDGPRLAYLLLLASLTVHQFLIQLNHDLTWINVTVFVTAILFFIFFVKSLGLPLKNCLSSKVSIFLSALPFLVIALGGAFKISQYALLPLYYGIVSIYLSGKIVLNTRRFDEVSVTLCALVVWAVVPAIGLLFSADLSLPIAFTLVGMGLINLVLSIRRYRQEYADFQNLNDLLKSYSAKESSTPELGQERLDIQMSLTLLDGTDKELTEREWEVADKLAAGLSAKDIATQLDVSYFTVKRHLQNMYIKFGVAGKKQFLEKLQAKKQRRES